MCAPRNESRYTSLCRTGYTSLIFTWFLFRGLYKTVVVCPSSTQTLPENWRCPLWLCRHNYFYAEHFANLHLLEFVYYWFSKARGRVYETCVLWRLFDAVSGLVILAQTSPRIVETQARRPKFSDSDRRTKQHCGRCLASLYRRHSQRRF